MRSLRLVLANIFALVALAVCSVFVAHGAHADEPLTPFPGPLGAYTSPGITAAAIIIIGDANYWRLDTTNGPVTGSGFTLSNDFNFTCNGGVNGFSVDGTTFSVDCTNDRIGIGDSSPDVKLDIESDVDGDGVIMTTAGTNATGGSGFYAYTSNGTIAAPTALASGDQIGVFCMSGYGTSFGNPVACMNAIATQAFTGTNKGTRLAFGTTPNGSTTRIDRMVIDQGGNVDIGTDTTPDAKLEIEGGSLPASEPSLLVTGTLNTAPSGRRTAIDMQITGAGSASNTISALSLDLAAGYTGSSSTHGMISVNNSVGTGTSTLFAGDVCQATTLGCNMGSRSEAVGSGAITNVGAENVGALGSVSAGAYNISGNTNLSNNGFRSNSTNYGSVNSVTMTKHPSSTTETHVGAVGIGDGGDVNVGVFAGLGNVVPTWTSNTAALLVKVASGETGDYIKVLEEQGGTTVFSLVQNGASGAVQLSFRPITTGAGSSILSFGSQGTQYFSLDSSGVVNFTGSATVYNGLAIDIATVGNEDLTLNPGNGAGSGSVVIISEDTLTEFASPNATVRGSIISTDADATFNLRQGTTAGAQGMISLTATRANIGVVSNVGATTSVLQVADGISSAGATAIFLVYGEGKVQVAVAQAVTCAAGVLALDPTSSVVNLDPNGAACVVTLGEANAIIGSEVTINITATAGAGLVTFPDVANVHNGPTLCTTTGIAEDGVYTIQYADKANDMYLGKACSAN